MRRTITTSFKEREAFLYDYVVKKSCSPGTYLKDLIYKDYEHEIEKEEQCSKLVTENSFDVSSPVIDFIE